MIRCEMIYVMIWYDMMWYDMIYDMIWYDTIWYDMIWWYDMIMYLLTAIRLTPGASSTVHIYTKTVHRTTQNKQYIKLKNMKECDNSTVHEQQLHTVCMSSNNFGHLITKTNTTLQHLGTLHHTSFSYTSLQLSTLHFLSFTLHYPLIWLNTFTFPTALFHLTSLN
jgi:hypothetical protein